VPVITGLEAIRLAIPFTHDGPDSGFGGSAWTKLECLLVRVSTDAGLTGWGEAFGYGAIPGTRALLEETIRPMVVGKPADDIAGLVGGLKRTLHVFGRSGPMQYALSGLDIALWDLAGKAAGLPVWRLLGGTPLRDVPAYASKLRLSDPGEVALSCEKAARRGLTGIKLHEVTVEATAAARGAVGPDVALMLDVNCEWSPADAIAIGHRLRPLDLAWFEEPVWPPEDLAGIARVRRETGVPVASGENAAHAHAFLAHAATPDLDILQPSVTKVGGVSEFVPVGHLARLHGKVLAPHSPYLGPGLLATLQMAAVFPEMTWVEHLSVELERRIFADVGWPGARGRVAIPDGPGLGADPDPEVIARYRV
jgi:L-alanine-DL-glutamate epimerase-like enolase superfamily enzyme